MASYFAPENNVSKNLIIMTNIINVKFNRMNVITDRSCVYFQGTFDAKDGSASAHAGITQAAAYYPYDPSLGQYQYDRY